jgi:hypothetical protein
LWSKAKSNFLISLNFTIFNPAASSPAFGLPLALVRTVLPDCRIFVSQYYPSNCSPHENRLWERAQKLGDFATKKLNDVLGKSPIVGDIRGKGLLIGVELVKNKKTKEPGICC